MQFNGSATQNGNVLQLTPLQQAQAGSVWFSSPINLTNGFSTIFTYNIFGGSSSSLGQNGADGLTFTLQSAGRLGIGSSGGELAAGGIVDAVSVSFRTYVFNTIELDGCGTGRVQDVSGVCSLGSVTGLSLRGQHTVQITYSLGVLTVIMDSRPVLSKSIDLTKQMNMTNGQAFVGFTASTGSDDDVQQILSWELSPSMPSLSSTLPRTLALFPQVADGYFSDGSYFNSTFLILPELATDIPTCNIQLYGLSASFGTGALSSSFTNTLPQASFAVLTTQANQPLKSGYAVLSCSSSVYAQVLYSFYSASGTKLGEATVFPADEKLSAQMIIDQQGGARLAVAIANNTDAAHSYSISLGGGGQAVTVSIPARASLAKFIDELFPLPANFVNVVLISTVDLTTFSSIGLRFTGNVFTTITTN